MSAGKRVAIVTGANKGIGYAVVRGLCKQFDGDVFLTARNEALGQEAVKKLNGEGLNPKFHQLDLCDKASIDRLKNFMQSTYGGIDILVNNAGIAFKGSKEKVTNVVYPLKISDNQDAVAIRLRMNDPPKEVLYNVSATEPFAQQAEVSVKTNFWGTLDVCKALFPLLKPHARVVNVSSRASHGAAKKCSDALKAKFTGPDVTVPYVEQLMTEFVSAAKQGNHAAKGWAESAYGCSKIGVTLMSFAQQKELGKDSRQDIIVNPCCPGYVDTDMTSHKGTKTIDDGADTLIYLALLPPNTTSPKGEFVAERKVIGFP